MKSKQNQIYSLLKIYSMILIVGVTVFSLVVSYTISKKNNEEAKQVTVDISNRIDAILVEDEKKAARMATELTSNPLRIENLYRYFQLDYQQYLSYTLDISQDYNMYIYLPKEIEHMYYLDESIQSVAISLNEFKEVYSSTLTNKQGIKLEEFPKDTGVMIPKLLNNPDTSKYIGTFYLSLSVEEFNKAVTNNSQQTESETFIFSNTNRLIYSRKTKEKDSPLESELIQQMNDHSKIQPSKLKESYFMTQLKTKEGYQIYTFVPKKSVFLKSAKSFLWLFLFSLIIDSILLLTLFKLFGKYVRQVEDILLSINEITKGKIENRIEVNHKQAEMKQISIGINQMLDSIQTYLKDIYELEIKQKDADMRALQSQINPHFLYNTLEYIRMSAVSEGADELAEVVYNFAALLRNNISQEKTVTLENELKFCEKYVYLYQMRYPDSIAYSFSIEESIKSLPIPKFAIQPLIENYFQHGIDYLKMENAIGVKAYRENKEIVIKISDNGLGMSEIQYGAINEALAFNHEVKVNSVGIHNVSTRLRLYYGSSYHMKYFPTKNGGTTIVIRFKDKEEQN